MHYPNLQQTGSLQLPIARNNNYSSISMARRLNRQKKASKNALRSDGKGSSACTARKYVHNLSQYTINDFEYTLLAKRLKFIPASRVNNAKRMVINDFDEFARKIRCSYHYSTGDDYTIHPFRKSWVISPPKLAMHLRSILIKLNWS